MKVPALILILFLLSAQVFVAGIPMKTAVSGNQRSCCTQMNPYAMQDPGCAGSGHCSCSPASGPMLPCSCGCSHSRMIAPVSSISDRLRNYFIRGYRRISKKNVLEHESRRILYHTICENPGLDIRSLANISGLNEHTLKYHLDQIITSGHVSVHCSGGGKHYFENHGTYSEPQQILLSRLHESGFGRILTTVLDNPGLSRGEIAQILGVSGPVISRSMQTLIEEGLILQVSDGKFRRYYPGWNPLAVNSSQSA